MLYKIVKQGYFSEDWLNETGKIVDIAPETAEPAVVAGYLKKASEARPIVKKKRKKK